MIDLLISHKLLIAYGVFIGLVWPLVGLWGIVHCRRRQVPRLFHVVLIYLSAFGPLCLAMWFVFNAIENRFGLDSVFALLLNLGLFCLVGVALGLAIRSTIDKRGF